MGNRVCLAIPGLTVLCTLGHKRTVKFPVKGAVQHYQILLSYILHSLFIRQFQRARSSVGSNKKNDQLVIKMLFGVLLRLLVSWPII